MPTGKRGPIGMIKPAGKDLSSLRPYVYINWVVRNHAKHSFCKGRGNPERNENSRTRNHLRSLRPYEVIVLYKLGKIDFKDILYDWKYLKKQER